MTSLLLNKKRIFIIHIHLPELYNVEQDQTQIISKAMEIDTP